MNEPLPSRDSSGQRGDGTPLARVALIEPPVRVRQGFAPLEGPASQALAPQWYRGSPPIKTYVVPKRFGLLSIIALTTVMALMFGLLRFYGASPVWFLFLGTLALAICIVQMFYGQVPRQASVTAGAILTPAFVVAEGIYRGWDAGVVVSSALACLPAGGFVGYLVGTCAAGIFLLIEELEPYLPGRRQPPDRRHPLEVH